MEWLFALLLVRAVLSSNPEENQNSHEPRLFEGDMVFTSEQRYHAEHGEDVDSDRKRGSIKKNLWPKATLIYTFDSSLAQRGRNAVIAAMTEWTRKTCIRFKQRTNEAGYVSFQNKESGCWSYVGRTGRKQPINLSSGCWTRLGTAVHEIAHALGFYHEQSRPDRDQYVTILYNNIEPSYRNNFNKYPRSTIDSLGTPYDYGSVMHYGSTFFSKNGRPTIVAKRAGVTLGQRRGLSDIDARQANLLYRCSATTTRPTTGSSCKDNRGYCPRLRRYCRSSSFVKANCKETCNLCGRATTTPRPTTPRPTTPRPTVSSCKDNGRYCPRWRRYCSSSSFVKANCKKTCNLCGPATTTPRPTGSSCVDKDNRCHFWTRYCGNNRFPSLKINCKKTCRLC